MATIEPDHRDVPYGPHPRNLLDVYLASGVGKLPTFVWIHGGGFTSGDKRNVPKDLLVRMLAAGVSVASINYRLSQQAPYPACMHDAARAVQFLRAGVGIGKTDPERLAVGGGSAGGGISLWLCFHEDMADPASDDVIAHQSTRPVCACCINTQSSYDPNFIRSIIPGPAGDGIALQLLFRAPVDRQHEERFREVFKEGSALGQLAADARPVLVFYRTPDAPLDETLNAGTGIHHPQFGRVLKEKMDALGVECVLSLREDHGDHNDGELNVDFAEESVAFCKRHFGM
jgi:acetyl esterase/lipase